jgi:hypothetical protein
MIPDIPQILSALHFFINVILILAVDYKYLNFLLCEEFFKRYLGIYITKNNYYAYGK